MNDAQSQTARSKSINGSDAPAPGLGTFAGVFTPSILTILGIILFLRLGYVVGSAGLFQALVIIMLANVISLLTTFSLSAVATSLRVKGGGDYYLISRTLGLSFGGAIGIVLFLAQSVSIGFYCIGFAEAMVAILPASYGLSAQPVAALAVAFLFVVAWLGTDWATRFQYVVMALIAAALASFTIGATGGWSEATLEQNWAAPATTPGFWIVFAIFFPAVTGFTQGVSMSGDLRDARKSIPFGTFLAVGISFVVYLGVAILFAAAMPGDALVNDYGAIKKIASIGPLIDLGVVAATLSSALASLLGAPRILQSLARDRIFPVLLPFALGHGMTGNPRRGVMLSAAIALGIIALGNLNLVASVVSMFFLVSYGLLNYATYYEAHAASPSFRPAFRWYDKRLSLVGSLACARVIFAIDLSAGIVAAFFVFIIFQYLRYQGVPARWANSRRSHHLKEVRDHLLAASAEAAHPRDWRPQLLAFSNDAHRRAQLLRFASWVEGSAGLTTVVRILEGHGGKMLKLKEEAEEELTKELKAAESAAFPLVVFGPNVDAVIPALVQSVGVGPLRANTVISNWFEGPLELVSKLGSKRYSQNLRTAFRLGCNLLVLDANEKEWDALDDIPPAERTIDVWWQANETGQLMLILAYLMTRSDSWHDAKIRILAAAGKDGADARAAEIREMLDKVRIGGEPLVVDADSGDSFVERSTGSSIVFMPFNIRDGRFTDRFGGEVGDILPRLPVVVLCMAAEDIELDADPDEGAAGEAAAAKDRLHDLTAEFDEAESVADEAAAARAASAALLELARGGAEVDKLEERQKELEDAQETARKAARKAAKLMAKKEAAEQAAKELGITPGDHDKENGQKKNGNGKSAGPG
ncbi:MAG: amino acid permease [Rhodospirillales bacterium]|nr:amino acid permease [Rhodospirillales bacterium]